MDADKLMRETARGEQARQLLENELLIEAFATLEQEIMQTWQASKAADEKAREKLWMMSALLRRLKEQITHIANTGAMAQKTLLQEEQRQSWLDQAKAKSQRWRRSS